MATQQANFPNGTVVNNDRFDRVSNPEGMAGGGQRENLIKSYAAVIDVYQRVIAAGDDVADDVAEAAASAVLAAARAVAAAGSADSALASQLAAAASALEAATYAGGGIKVTSSDTTHKLLNDAITVTAPLTKAVTAPGGNEKLNLALDLTARPSMAQLLWQQIFS